MNLPEASPKSFDKSQRRQRFFRVPVIILFSAYLLALASMVTRSFLLNTDWHDAVQMTFFNMIVAAFATPVVITLYAIGNVLTGSKPLRFMGAWSGFLLPVIGAVAIIIPAALDRIFPGRLFQEFTGLDLPPSARVLSHSYDCSALEDHFMIIFRAPVSEMRTLINDFGLDNGQGSGVQIFETVPVHGDYGRLEVDWNYGRAVFEYLDV